MDKINETIKEFGMKNTELNRKTADERNFKSDVENYTTAYDLTLAWKKLSEGSFLSKKKTLKCL